MFRKILKISGSLLLVIFIIGTLAFTSGKSKITPCSEIEIYNSDNDIIKVDKDDIIKIIKSTDKKLFSKKLRKVNSEVIEKAIEKHPAVLNAEVYKVTVNKAGTYKGILAVKIEHRKPVIRIISNTGNYYLDRYGKKIPVSLSYTANVLVATGNFTEKYAKTKLLPFVMYIENSKFWDAQIQQINVDKNGNILLTPLVGNHIIDFGKVDNYKRKLAKMEAFYKQVLAKNNWNKYSRITLKYNNQIVAKRR